MHYFSHYYCIEDIFVTQEKAECKVNIRLQRMGFLDAGSETDHLEPGRKITLPLWYIKDLKVNNAYFTVCVPDIFKTVHKAVCEADATNIEPGRLHPYFYEFGRYLTPYDSNHGTGRIIYETLRQRVRHLLDMSKNNIKSWRNKLEQEYRLDNIEANLFAAGSKTNAQFINWLEFHSTQICISSLVEEHLKKRSREDERASQSNGN